MFRMINFRTTFEFVKRRGWVAVVTLPIAWLLLCECLLYLARSKLVAREPKECIEFINLFESLRGPTGESRFLAARSFRRIGDMSTARRCLKESQEQGYSRTALEREGWLILAQAGAINRVESKLRRMLVSPGEDAREICEAYVCGYLLNYRFDDAMGLLGAWQADFPLDTQPLLIRGQCLEHSRQFGMAAEVYESALKIDDSRSEIRCAFVRCLIELHRHDDARREIDRLLNESSENPESNVLAGRLFLETAQIAEAESHFRSVLKIAPQHVEARCGLSKVLLATDRADEALKIVRLLAHDDPFSTESGFLLQRALTMTGKIDEAIETGKHYEKMRSEQAAARVLVEQVQLNPTDASLRLAVGRILVSYGAPSDARVWLRSVLELDATNREALQLLDKLEDNRASQ
jgi:tetratricopeptide (TPR) repeat protein